MKEQIINFETAKLAKEKGFKEECERFIYHGGEPLQDNLMLIYKDDPEFYFVPTQSILQKWLREEYKLDALPIIRSSGKYSYDIYHYDNPNSIGERTRYNSLNSYSTYEEALESALVEALNLIK